jgi:exodeoxyribonuclease V alpha subunit
LPLDPRGAIAAHFRGDPTRDIFRRLGVGSARCDLGDQGLYLAEEIARLDFTAANDPTAHAALAALVLASQIAARGGATRLPLDKRGPLRELLHAIAKLAGAPDIDADALLARILHMTREASRGSRSFGSALGAPGEQVPLIVDGEYVYTHALYALETATARRLVVRLATQVATAPAAIADALADVRARPSDVALSDEQAAAVAIALAAPLAIVSGGPGTGKTQVAAAIVRVLARLGATRIGLAAPTGKAAHRLGSSLTRQLAAVRDPDDADRALALAPPAASTLHRLLGVRPGAPPRHDERHPLPFDAVLIDEASMLDLTLTEQLLRATPPGARLILIGDAHQLAPVDAGQVLADLVKHAADRAAPWCAVLTRSFRADADRDGQALLAAAAAIDADQGNRLLGKDRLMAQRADQRAVVWRGAEHVDTTGQPRVRDAVIDAHLARALAPADLALATYRRVDGAWLADDAARLHRLMDHHERRRILCATRSQDAGALAINARLHAHALARTTLTGAPAFVPGEPVIMTSNDYARGFWNGDPGVIANVADDHATPRHRVILRRGDELVPLPIDAVRGAVELAWALTVHRSQGSEYDEVTVVLPDEILPIATRELLYTALTRARRGAVVVAPREVMLAAVKRTAPRSSGLVARLGQGAR